MKLTALFLTIALTHAVAGTNAQKITLSGKDLTYKKVFDAIEKQTGYMVFGNKDLFASNKTISLTVFDLPLKDLLDYVLKDQLLTYDIQDKTIFISKKKGAEAPVVLPEKEFIVEPIKGYVRDSIGQPLSGATVLNKRSKKTVETNLKGEFSIEAEEGDVLSISYIGFSDQLVKVAGNFMPVILKRSTSPLDEVQVIAYGTTSRRLNTGNVTTIKAEEIQRHPVSNVLLALQGRVPNLSIIPQSGNPGARIGVQLRGQNSLSGYFTEQGESLGLTGATTPLLVIDGVPQQMNIRANYGAAGDMVSSLSFLSTENIESVDVLADADATSIYGSRGGNGVILITTKKGKAGKTSINLNINHGFSLVPQKSLASVLNTDQYLEMRREAYLNDGLPVPDLNTADKNSSNYDLTLWDPNRYTDWQKVLMGGKAPWTQAALSLNGGTEFVQYTFGINYRHQGYTLPASLKGLPTQKSDVTNFHLNLSGSSPNRRFKTSLGFTYGFSATSSGADFTSIAIRIAPNAPSLYLPNGELNWEPDATGFASWTNPLAATFNVTEVESNSLNSNILMSYELLPSLRMILSGGYNRIGLESIALGSLKSYDPAKVAAGINTGSATRQFSTSSSWIVEPRIEYNTRILEGRMNVLTGVTAQYNSNNVHSVSGYGYTDDALIRDLSKAISLIGGNTSNEYKYNGIYAKINYNWQDKYILNINARRDGSSRFGPGRQYGNFLSVGAAWIFTAENFSFLQKYLPFISFGKIRGSYGTSGNDGIGDYKYVQLYETPINNTYQGLPYLQSRGVINPDYKWEQVRKLEGALDLGLFHNRVNISFSYWRSRSGDQLTRLNLPSTAGPGSVLVANQPALIQNSGTVFSLDVKLIDKKAFNWNLRAYCAFQENKLLKIPPTFLSWDFNYIYQQRGEDPVGKPFGGLVFVREYRGINPATGIYQFSKKDGSIANESYEEFGYAKKINVVQQTLNISNVFNYQSFSLAADLVLVKQNGTDPIRSNIVFQGAPGRFESTGNLGNQPVEVMNRWIKSGDNAEYQRFTTQGWGPASDAFYSMAGSDGARVDASYIRLTNISLSYDISGLLKKKLLANNAAVYCSMQNLLTITAYKFGDPATQSPFSLPMLKTITAGIRIGF